MRWERCQSLNLVGQESIILKLHSLMLLMLGYNLLDRLRFHIFKKCFRFGMMSFIPCQHRMFIDMQYFWLCGYMYGGWKRLPIPIDISKDLWSMTNGWRCRKCHIKICTITYILKRSDSIIRLRQLSKIAWGTLRSVVFKYNVSTRTWIVSWWLNKWHDIMQNFRRDDNVHWICDYIGWLIRGQLRKCKGLRLIIMMA